VNHADHTLSAGEAFACAIHDDGTLWCWGSNESGQLGVGTTNDSAVPVQVGTDSDWVDISCGLDRACGLHGSYELDCWGDGVYGQLGSSLVTTSYVTTPVPVDQPSDWTGSTHWAGLAQGIGNHACAIDSDGLAYCWGANDVGELGTGGGFASSPSKVQGGPWSDIFTGLSHTCALSNSQVQCWGANEQGQVQPGSSAYEVDTPAPVAVGSGWTSLALGLGYSCALGAKDRILCWGGPWSEGEPIGAGKAWVTLSSAWSQSCARGADASVWCWQSGLDSTGVQTGPATPPAQIGAGTFWADISVGGEIACAVDAAGAVACWPLNSSSDASPTDNAAGY
jgi:alpha-tubulin suppressor-like RCC1 family protein